MNSIPQRLRGDSISSLRAIYPSQKPSCYFALLIANKLSYCIGVFLAYDVLRHVHVVPLVCVLKLIAGGVFLVVQKPLTGKSITETQWLYTVHLALGRVIISVLWFYGMGLCGPFRAILVFEQHDFVVIAGFAALTTGAGGPAAFRGAVVFLSGLLVLLFLDHDEGRLHPDRDHVGSGLSWMGLADHKVGVLLMVAVLLAQVGVNSLAARLGADIGGQKRLHSLTTIIEGVVLVPLSLIIQLRQDALQFFFWSSLFPLLTVSLCVFVVNFYINSFCQQRLDIPKSARVGSIAVFAFSLFIAFVWSNNESSGEHALSGGGVFACALFIVASTSLTSESKQGAKGSFIGYSESGHPLYSFKNSVLEQTSKSVLLHCGAILRQILSNRNSRKIFYFLCLNMAFTGVEFVYGVWTNSLGLISDGFHMLFDCSALIMGLIASVMATWKPSRTFSFGYSRVEDLSGFVNGLFLLVISFFIFTEALSRLFDPPDINTNQLLAVSVAGLCVNMLGILVFRHNGSSHGHSHGGQSSHGHSHNSNMEGVFLHILADTLGSVGVITSSLLIEHFGWFIADPICSLLISILIFASVIPLLKNASKVLLLSVPQRAKKELENGLKKVLAVEGVVSVKEPHLWLHSGDSSVSTVRVQVAPGVGEQRVAQQVTAIFKSLGFSESTVQVEKEEFYTHLSGLGVDYQRFNQRDFISQQNNQAVVNVKSV